MNDLAERRQEEKERRRAEILAAAEATAEREGWEAMTMDQVARRARVSRPLLYIYFQDKTDLMFGVGERALQELRRRFAAAAARHRRGIDQVRAIGRAYVGFSRECPLYFSVLARCELRSPSGDASTNERSCAQCGEALHGILVAALETGRRDGTVRRDGAHPRVVSMALWGFMHGVISLTAAKANVLAHNGVTVEQLMEQGLRMATRSVAAAAPAGKHGE